MFAGCGTMVRTVQEHAEEPVPVAACDPAQSILGRRASNFLRSWKSCQRTLTVLAML